MNRTDVTRGAAAVAGPLVLLAVPKCPLCLLPLLAAAGVAVPPAPVLDALVAAVVVAWTIVLVRVAATRTLRVAGVIAGSIVNRRTARGDAGGELARRGGHGRDRPPPSRNARARLRQRLPARKSTL